MRHSEPGLREWKVLRSSRQDRRPNPKQEQWQTEKATFKPQRALASSDPTTSHQRKLLFYYIAVHPVILTKKGTVPITTQ
jgi:hypothetical protein